MSCRASFVPVVEMQLCCKLPCVIKAGRQDKELEEVRTALDERLQMAFRRKDIDDLEILVDMGTP